MLLPVALDVRSRPCLVVGGGPVGARKVASLLECGASVTLISPALSREAQVLAVRCKYLPRPFEGDDCAGMVLVYACTPSREVNDSIARAARRVGAWCCVADDASAGDLHGAATVRRGDICIGISTGGASPALSKHLKAASRKRGRRIRNAARLDERGA
jgi:precorrin-2 dehydrogenase/sirohydrochlorin ferrochelatase